MKSFAKKAISLPFLASVLIALQGAILILDELTLRSFAHIELIIPGSRYGSMVVGSGLLYVAFELRRAKRSAWWIAYIFTLLAIFLQIVRHHQPLSLLLSFMTLGVLIFSYGHFRVVSQRVGMASGFRRAIILSGVFIAVSALGFLALKKRHFGISFSLGESLKHAFTQLYIGTSELKPITRQGKMFLDLVDVMGYINYLLVMASFFKPAADKFIVQPHVQQQVLELLRRHSTSSEDYFKYWPHDKSYFFNASHSGFVAYKTVKSICIAPADPINTTEARQKKLLEKFIQFNVDQGWTSVFAHVPESSKQLYSDCGYKLIKIGASAVVPIDRFLNETARSKNFRNIINRFEKAGYSHEVVKPHEASPALLTALKRISDSWLKLPSRTERGFFLGYFNEDYMNESTLFILKDGAGQIVAFANLQPNFGFERASVDLMRHLEDAITNTMDYMFYALMKYLKEQNWKELDLGLAPLSNLDDAEHLEEKGLKLVYEYANRWFAFQGLARFKQKFEPDWEGSYLAYRGTRAELPLIVYALDKVMEVKSVR